MAERCRVRYLMGPDWTDGFSFNTGESNLLGVSETFERKVLGKGTFTIDGIGGGQTPQ